MRKCAYDLDAAVDVRVHVVKEQGILSVELQLSLALRLSLRVIVVLRLEILVVLLLVVWDVSSHSHLGHGLGQ